MEPQRRGDPETERHGDTEMGCRGARTVRGRHAGKGAEQEGAGAQQDPGRGTEREEVAGRDLEMAETRACVRETRGERGSRARSADPTAPRYNVSGGGGGELKASGREIKTNTEMRGANRGWGRGVVVVCVKQEGGGPGEAERAREVGEREVDGARWGDGREERLRRARRADRGRETERWELDERREEKRQMAQSSRDERPGETPGRTEKGQGQRGTGPGGHGRGWSWRTEIQAETE